MPVQTAVPPGDQRENSRKSLSNSGQRLVELRYPGDQLKVRPAHHDDVSIRVGVRIEQITHLGHGRVRRQSIVSTVAMCMTVGKVSFADWRDFTRRFEEADILNLMEITNTVRERVWRQQPRAS